MLLLLLLLLLREAEAGDRVAAAAISAEML
jgi:hypothetical protein